MRCLFNIGHPAEVHLFKNLIHELENRGHECVVTTIDKEVSISLLENYGIEHFVVGRESSSILMKGVELLFIEYRLLMIAHRFKPDVLIGGVGNAYVAHVGKLIGKPSIIFDDTEHAKLQHFLTDPFATAICTPSCYRLDLGSKQVRYDGYHELAYLHPNYFQPDPELKRSYGMLDDEHIIIIRLVSWGASHDVGHHGLKNKIKLVEEMSLYGRVIITSEADLPPELMKYRIAVPPEKLHDLLFHASLCIGEGATTASECAILGTHTLYVNTLGLGYISDISERYGLIVDFSSREFDDAAVIREAKRILEIPDFKALGKSKACEIVKDKIDVTSFMVSFIETLTNPEGIPE